MRRDKALKPAARYSDDQEQQRAQRKQRAPRREAEQAKEESAVANWLRCCARHLDGAQGDAQRVSVHISQAAHGCATHVTRNAVQGSNRVALNSLRPW